MAFQGSLRELPLPDIVQLVSVSGKTGRFALRREGHPGGEIYLRAGQMVHARVGDLEGEEAVYELAIWPEGDFTFHAGEESPGATIQKSNTNLLMEAARRIDEWQVLSKRIPSTRLVPVFTDQATTTSVSLTALEWRLVCKIDERRTVDDIAASLGQGPFDTCKLLYGLVTSGLVALKEDLSSLGADRLQKMTPEELREVFEGIHRQASALLANGDSNVDLDSAYRTSRSELDAGRGSEAVVDLVRAEEKLVSAALGPNQSKVFLDRVQRLLGGR
jgi:hypothetical protein